MNNVNELRILTIRDADFIVRDDRADGLEEYKAFNDAALAEIRTIAEDAATMSQVESKIEEKIGGLAGEGNTSTVKKNADDIATLFKQMSWNLF